METKLVAAVTDHLALAIALESKVQVGGTDTPAVSHEVPCAAQGLELPTQIAEGAAVRMAAQVAVALGGTVEEAGVGLVVDEEDAPEVLCVPLGLVLSGNQGTQHRLNNE